MDHNLTQGNDVSIQGTLLMLDGKTPHVAVPVQAICAGKVIATTLSDEIGRYQLANLNPERYQVLCHVLGGYVYYGEGGSTVTDESRAVFLQVKSGVICDNIDFRFAPFKKGQWKHYTSLDGLAHKNVWAIYCDPDGVMWFGTTGGISRYDGREFVNFTTRDGLVHSFVSAIHRDPNGVMWFGTTGGVSRYDGKQFSNFTTEDGLADNFVTCICRSPDGNLWLGTHGGVSRYDGKQFSNFTTEDGLAGNFVTAIYSDPDGIVWFGTSDGISRHDGKEFLKNLTCEDGLANDAVIAIHRDSDGMMWFGTWDGVSRYDGTEFVNFRTQDGLLPGGVKAIHSDPDGVMWFGMAWSGASRYDGNVFVNFTVADGLGSNAVHVVRSGPDGAMWFGTPGGGISRYSERDFVTFTERDGLPHINVQAMHRVSNYSMWIGTENGVSHYDGKTFANLNTRDGLVNNSILSIHREPDGTVWFGGNYGGLSRYDGERFVNFTAQNGELPHDKVWAIHRDRNGVMWFGTGYAIPGGATRYDGKEFITFTTKDGLASDMVLAICSDCDGAVWFGTDQGISRYDGKKFVNLTTKDGLLDNHVGAIHCDPDGVMWFGTSSGISRYDSKEFVNFTTQDGLAYGFVISIHRAPDGVLWFGTDGGGICMYDGTAWSSLDSQDGLPGNTVAAIGADSDGSLWLGTDNGLVRYRRSSTPPEGRIISVTTDQTYRDLSHIPVLIAGQRVTIEYSCLDLKTAPQKRQYRCRIEEVDTGWRKPTKASSFDYTFEKAGTYTFEVQAIDRDLNYSEPAKLSLTVQPDPVLVSMQTELSHLRREVQGKYDFGSIIGRSEGIRQVRALMEGAIDSGLTVLISGETGTGKELVAKAIHYNSQRKDQPLLDLNCGAVPRDLLASTLFGHRRGAFTGATEDKMGLFETASGGTILLDEIGEMPQDAQVHLLRVLEERKVQRVGEYISRDVDVRIIAMTNRDLFKDVKSGRFREDLYYRVSEFIINVPPLRERPEDIPLLARHFLQEINRELEDFAPDALEMLQSYSWPGNVRELRNAIRRAAAMVEQGAYIQTYHFPPQITHGEALMQEATSEGTAYSEAVDNFRRRLIIQVLKECNGNRHEAARHLRMHRSNLIALIKRLNIDDDVL